MRARAKSYEDLRESRLLDVLAMSDSVRKAARSALCLLLLLHAPGVNGQQKIYFGVNALCTSDSNCTVAGQKCLSYKYRDNDYQICRCQNESRAGINCVRDCPTTYGNLPICNARGECNYQTAICACSNGWQGQNCTAECPGGEASPCSRQGDCVQSGVNGAACVCYPGFRGNDCSIECTGGSSSPCLNHGFCEADGSCSCYGGWRGADCSIACPGGSVTPCNGHGLCEVDATCSCSSLYRGTDCCFRCPDYLSVPCGGRGFCQVPTGAVCDQTKLDSNIAKCICNNGFRGDNCMIECNGGSSNPCSGHGTCEGDGSCTCTLGWTGLACENACPGQQLPCSGHGTCVGINITGCKLGCYQVTPTSAPLCNCQTGIQDTISYYYGTDCSQSGYSALNQPSPISSASPSVAVTFRVSGASRSSFDSVQQIVFIRVLATTVASSAGNISLVSLEDVKPADFTFDGSSTFSTGTGVQTSQIQTTATVTSTPILLISLLIALVDNAAADTMVKTLKTVIKSGIFDKALHDEGLTAISVTIDGVTTILKPLKSDDV